ncbi:MAG TPA: MDR family MFS transporter, partial [Candidatus Limnocylindrales bacterium]|nr:MDR family MFS transporter [Candidatus Limnocylindrales bacterium]
MEAIPAGANHGAPPLMHLDRRAKTEILVAILLALFLGALDQTIVGVALPTIATKLGGAELYAWSITIYLLTSTITGPFYGKLSDLFGRKPMLIFGVSVFLLGSALSGLSQNMEMLILFRGIQGIGAGALFPVALAVIGDLYTPAERGKYQGLFGAVFGVSSIIGPLLGGFLTEQVGWQWIFYVNLPIGLVSLFVIWRLLPNIRREGASRNLDYLGAAVFTFAISFLLLGLSNKGSGEWTDPVVGGFILLGLLGSLVFLLVESRAAEPIVPLRLFRNQTYATSIAATFFAAFGFFAAIIWLPLWFQFVEGASPTNSGLYALPLLAGLIVSSIASGILVARTGRYKAILVGAVVTMLAGLWLMSNLRFDTPLPLIWAWMFVAGAGVGPTLSVFTISVQNAVPVRDL